MRAEAFSYRSLWGVSSRAIVGMLLEHGARVGYRTVLGQTALHVAAENRSKPDDDSLVVQLIEAGADVNAATSDGTTPLMEAVSAAKVNKVRALLRSGARADLKDARGRTAMAYAGPQRGDSYDVPFCYWRDIADEKPASCAAIRRLLTEALAATRR